VIRLGRCLVVATSRPKAVIVRPASRRDSLCDPRVTLTRGNLIPIAGRIGRRRSPGLSEPSERNTRGSKSVVQLGALARIPMTDPGYAPARYPLNPRTLRFWSARPVRDALCNNAR